MPLPISRRSSRAARQTSQALMRVSSQPACSQCEIAAFEPRPAESSCIHCATSVASVDLNALLTSKNLHSCCHTSRLQKPDNSHSNHGMLSTLASKRASPSSETN
eukprot:4232347-Amphidinium_carterae.1